MEKAGLVDVVVKEFKLLVGVRGKSQLK